MAASILTHRKPWLVAFVFGLLHGLGFPGARGEFGLPGSAIPLALLFFNLGVEAGQLLFALALLALHRLRGGDHPGAAAEVGSGPGIRTRGPGDPVVLRPLTRDMGGVRQGGTVEIRRVMAFVSVISVLALFVQTTSAFAQGSDDVRLNRAIELLANGQAAFGVLSADYSLDNARTLARSNLDFIIIDMEPFPFDVERLHLFLLGMTNKRLIQEKGNLQMNVTPFVRVPATGGEEVQVRRQTSQVLNAGVFGVMYPSISTREEAENAVRAMRFPQAYGVPAFEFEPAGLRGLRADASWFWGVRDYMQRADVWPHDPQGELLAIIQIETPEGVANIEEIVSVPGVGVIFIEPSDLTTSMGFPPGSEIEAAIQSVLSACLAQGVPCAITTGSGSVERRLSEGFRFVTVGSSGVADVLQRGRAAAGR